MKGILLAAQIEGVSSRRDNTIKVTLGTQELSPVKAGELLALNNRIVSVYISESEINPNEVGNVDRINPEFTGKTQSQRLKNVLYILYSQQPEGFTDFDSFYKHRTEQIINQIKTK